MAWDLMYPRGCHMRHAHKQHKKTRCLECRAEIGTTKVNGHKVSLVYCQRHFCARLLPGGLICTQKNDGRSAYCENRVLFLHLSGSGENLSGTEALASIY